MSDPITRASVAVSMISFRMVSTVDRHQGDSRDVTRTTVTEPVIPGRDGVRVTARTFTGA
jgi:hypothetical protein